jgi:hypothetical protein
VTLGDVLTYRNIMRPSENSYQAAGILYKWSR